ncbi:MAG: transcription termination/antitermination protein NusA [Clostridia bacterium]|nr:transcription termination/antitermination protein NusA [Clostridia bacterium]
MVNKDFFAALNELCLSKGIDRQSFLDTLQNALTSAYKKYAGDASDVVIKYNEEKCSLKFYACKQIVEVVEDPSKEITLEEAKTYKKSYKLGDTFEKEFVPKEFGRIAAQTAKQVVMQKIREAERVNTIQEFEDKENEIHSAIVRRVENGTVYVELAGGGLEGVMLPQDQIANEKYEVNDKITVYVKKIRNMGRTTQVMVSRTATGLVTRFFENEVPEIRQGIVVVKAVSREAGQRSKIAIFSEDPQIDAVGACVGNKGMRVNAVIEQLGGEKIDIIPWSDNPLEFIARALAPAKVLRVTAIDEKSAMVVVPDDKLSLAIGKDGQNARLAAKLTGWKIDVKSESKAMEEITIENFEEIEDIDDLGEIADFDSVGEIEE